MEQNFSNKGEQLVKKRIRWKRWRKIFSVLACVVVFCTTYALILPAITIEKKASCGYEEHPGHSKELGCFEEVTTLTCGQEETPGHTHSDECYEIVTTLVCGMEEGEEHTHDDMCYSTTTVLVCTEAETPGHTHTEECYTTEEQLVCTKPIHSHSLNCYEKEETEVKDSKEEQTTDEKSKDRSDQTTDEKSENHSDKTVDVESRSDWEKTLEGVKLTGYWDKDIVAIAESQLGYAESTRNYVVQDGRRFGYSRYGQWYGNAYGDWCAMFVSYCLHYADVDEALMPRDANCQNWINVLTKEDNLDKKDRVHDYHYYRSDAYLPKAGDLIFFDWDGYKNEEDRVSDHIGIVAELLTDRKGNVEKVKTIEGNSSDKVQYVTYDIDDVNIMGYGELPINPEKADEIIEKTVEERTYTVTVKYPRKTKISEDAELVAEEYSKRSDEYKARYAEAAEFYGWTEEDDFRDDFRLFNIGLYEYNRELQPEGEVDVQITYKKQKKLDEKILQVTHFSDEIEKIKVTSKNEDSKEIIDFKTEGFSDFGVLLMDDADLDMSFDTFEEESIMLLAAASDNDSNLLAYFKFDGNLNDSSGNNAKATINGGSEHYGYTSVHAGQSIKFEYSGNQAENGYGTYLTITRADGTPLLTGYDEVSFDFWMKAVEKSTDTTGDIKNQWPIYAANNSNPRSYNNERYLAFYVNETATTTGVERYRYGRQYTDEPYIFQGYNLNNQMVHVHIDYNANNMVLNITDNNGNVLVSKTANNSKSISDILGTNSILQIGRANWGTAGEFFNGYIDELKIYGKSNNSQEDATGMGESDLVGHVSFNVNGSATDYKPALTEETGNANVIGYKNNAQVAENQLTYAWYNYAPVNPRPGETNTCFNPPSTNKEYFRLTAKDGTTLLKEKGYDEFMVDVWVRPEAKQNDATDFGVFTIRNGNNNRYIEVYLPYNNNNPSSVELHVRGGNGGKITVDCNQSLLDKTIRIRAEYHVDKSITLIVLDEFGNELGSGLIPNCGMTMTQLFENSSGEEIRGGVDSNNHYFNGFMDEFKVYARNSSDTPSTPTGGSYHPQTSVTVNLPAHGVSLYNVDTKGGVASPLAGVEYTVYDSNGNEVMSKETTDEFVLVLGDLPAGTYTIKQTAVPDGYVLEPQEKTFEVKASADNLTQAGIFFDYSEDEGYKPDKVAEVVDYANRMFDIQLSAQSGDYAANVQPKNFNFVVDQSNSMLFPAVLTKTGANVQIYRNGDKNSSTTDDVEGNGARFEAALQQHGLPIDQCYYVIAYKDTKATVYAVWKSSNGSWYYQDAAYYAQAQMGVRYADGSLYLYQDDPNITDNRGGPLNGTNGALFNNDLPKDINDNPNGTTSNYKYKNYEIYTGSEMNRLTYLKYAVKRMIYQLGAMDSTNTVTITTFDNYLESCMSRNVNAQNLQGTRELIAFVDSINTGGGTAQNYGLWHLLGKNSATASENKSGCTDTHLKGDGTDYVVLITDGALNANNKVVDTVNAKNQEEDLLNAGKAIRDFEGNPKLITIGLSVQNVTEAQILLNNAPNGVATPGFAYLDKDADELSVQLSNALIGALVELQPIADTTNIIDYISDSFYLVDTDGTALAEGDWLNLSGKKVEANAADKAGQVGHDEKGWYVEWYNQTLEVGSGETTIYKYQDGTVLDTSKTYYIDTSWNLHMEDFTNRQYRLVFENGSWRLKRGSENHDAAALGRVSSAIPTWRGKIYIKAKEDFIGGNTIDTNKGNAEIQILDNKGEIKAHIDDLETPTVNVRLLPINEISSEETVFLGDKISVREKIEELFKQIHFTKIVSNGDDVHNKVAVGSSSAAGLTNDTFDLNYAAGLLTDEQWEKLFNGEEVTVQYEYDAASSHGPVGEFTIKLTKDGDTSDYDLHTTTESGAAVETYTLSISYTAEGITDGTRNNNVHNYGQSDGEGPGGPGREVGIDDSTYNTVEHGLGTITSTNEHEVNVVDGKVTIIKEIDESLKDEVNAQTYTFTLEKLVSEATGDTEAIYETVKNGDDSDREVEITIAAGELEGESEFDNLARGTYRLVEKGDDSFELESMTTVAGETNCMNASEGTKIIEFTIGSDEEGRDVIIWNNEEGYHNIYSALRKMPYTDSPSMNNIVDITDANYQGVSYETTRVKNSRSVKEIEIPVEKRWEEVPQEEYEEQAVYVALYRDDEPLNIALRLDKDNDWKGSFKVSYTYGEDIFGEHGYSVRELSNVAADGKIYQFSSAKLINVDPLDDGEYPVIYYQEALTSGLMKSGYNIYEVEISKEAIASDDTGSQGSIGSQNQKFVVTNKDTYELPETGGIGTTLYTLGGAFLMIVSLLYGLLLRRRRERRLY